MTTGHTADPVPDVVKDVLGDALAAGEHDAKPETTERRHPEEACPVRCSGKIAVLAKFRLAGTTQAACTKIFNPDG